MLTISVRRRARLAAAALVAAALALPAGAAGHGRDHGHKPKSVDVQLLGINDFHGQLEVASGSNGRIGPVAAPGQPATHVNAGGAEYLATHIRQLESANPNSLVVSAGDLIGASPLLSALFHDEPTIEAMNKIGLDLNAVGNHEFDEGADELLRMQYGGCHPTDGCRDGDGFAGANFKFLAANVVTRDTNRPLFRPFSIKKFDGVKVGFIGMTLKGTPLIVTPTGIANLKFLDEADTANYYARILKRRFHVDAIVVLLHEGGVPTNPLLPSTVNGCVGVDNPIRSIVERTSHEIDLFMTGHTHQAYNCVMDGRPVTSAYSLGRIVTDVDLKIDRHSGEVTQVAADNKIITQDVPKAADITALIKRYDTLAAPFRDRVIGHSSAVISRTTGPDGESAAGNLIADSQLAATDDASTGQAVAAFMNIGGVRTDFPAGPITYGAAFAVQPFGNNLTTITLTGAQVWTLLQQQWCGQPGDVRSTRILQPSSTIRYTFSAARVASACSTNPVTELSIAGAPVPNDASQSYRVTVNSFLADGGDAFAVLPQGANRLGGPVDLDAIEAYLQPSIAGPPIDPPATDRITQVP
jgi:5'-nucleotidase